MARGQGNRSKRWSLLIAAAVGIGVIVALWPGAPRVYRGIASALRATPVVPPDAAAPPAPQPVRMVEPPREDIWQTLSPQTRAQVKKQMGLAGPPVEPEEIDQGKNGVMTRLPDRYRPVTVATIHNGKLVIGEVMNIPPEQNSPPALTKPPPRAR